MMNKPTGFVIYQGPSLLDGSPIVAIALTGSSNRKTGNMVQTYILRADMRPSAAAASGDDRAICGNCKHRPSTGGACYVVVCQGPTVVFKAWQRGKYPDALNHGARASLGDARMVRLGTYGDPAAVPAAIWHALISRSVGHTGYTHQWQSSGGSAQDLRSIVMASVDTPEELERARAMQWRAFRVRLATEQLAPREIICPASAEAGKVRTCLTCGACSGSQRMGQTSIAIIAHGGKARRFIELRAT